MDAQLIVFVLAVSAVRNTLSPDHLGSLCYAFRSLIQCQLKQEALDSPPSHFPHPSILLCFSWHIMCEINLFVVCFLY